MASKTVTFSFLKKVKLANGGNECYEEKSVPNSFAEIDKILN